MPLHYLDSGNSISGLLSNPGELKMLKQGLKLTVSKAVTGLLIANLVFVPSTVTASSESPSSDADKKPMLIDLWQPGDSGQRMNIRGQVTSLDGTPLSGIKIEIRQPDGDGDWIEQYQATLTTDAKGRYQFGSVVPESNYCGAPAVQVKVYQDGWEYFDTNIVFEDDTEVYEEDGTPVFLEESTVKGETMMFGRFDIVLSQE
jgi:protocatechuate 3,4-dioxygenase beta subunit